MQEGCGAAETRVPCQEREQGGTEDINFTGRIKEKCYPKLETAEDFEQIVCELKGRVKELTI